MSDDEKEENKDNKIMLTNNNINDVNLNNNAKSENTKSENTKSENTKSEIVISNVKSGNLNNNLNISNDSTNIYTNIRCKHTNSCITLLENKCKFFHTEEEIKEVEQMRKENKTFICRFGKKCKNINNSCKYDHTRIMKCKNGDKCPYLFDNKCIYDHSDDDFKKVKEIKKKRNIIDS